MVAERDGRRAGGRKERETPLLPTPVDNTLVEMPHGTVCISLLDTVRRDFSILFASTESLTQLNSMKC